MASHKEKPHTVDSNRDPITGEPGAHPVGAGVGAAVGGGVAVPPLVLLAVQRQRGLQWVRQPGRSA